MIKISIVEDEPTFAEVAAWELSQEQDMQVVGNYRCAEVALVEIPKHCPDVILMDISLPGIMESSASGS
jgi:DNA-binding NarL/FixJ family response regulator